MKKYLAVGLIIMSTSAMADEFDITMDVVEADETFDEAIVNRISLPFASDAAAKGSVAPRAEDKRLNRLEELEQFVGESMGDPSGVDSGSGVAGVDGIEGIEAGDLPWIENPRKLLSGNR